MPASIFLKALNIRIIIRFMMGYLKQCCLCIWGYFEIEQNYNLGDYKDYRLAVDSIRKASGIEISRNGFDHLLWYYHKGRM